VVTYGDMVDYCNNTNLYTTDINVYTELSTATAKPIIKFANTNTANHDYYGATCSYVQAYVASQASTGNIYADENTSANYTSAYLIKFSNYSSGDQTGATPGYVKAYVGGSSRRWKENIGDVTDISLSPDILYKIPVRQFKYSDNYIDSTDAHYGKNIIGFIAEELEEIYPVCTEYGDSKEVVGWNPKYIIPPMLALIQEQHKQIDDLQSQINELKEKINGNSSIQ
jgi:hypothetical protein